MGYYRITRTSVLVAPLGNDDYFHVFTWLPPSLDFLRAEGKTSTCLLRTGTFQTVVELRWQLHLGHMYTWTTKTSGAKSLCCSHRSFLQDEILCIISLDVSSTIFFSSCQIWDLSSCFGVIYFSYGVYLEHFSCGVVGEDGVRSHICLHLFYFFSPVLFSTLNFIYNQGYN